MNPVFYIKAKTQQDNVGDLVINELLIGELCHRGATFVNIIGCRSEYRDLLRLHPCEFVSVPSYFEIFFILYLRLLKGGLFYVMKPGHYFDRARLPVKKIFFLTFAWLITIAGVRIVRVGASIGPFSPIGNTLERMTAAAYAVYGIRESISYSLAKTIGVKSVAYCPDMAFLLKGVSLGKRFKISLSFREGILASDGEYEKPVLENVSRLKKIIAPGNFSIVTQVERDGKFNEKIRSIIDPQAPHLIFPENSIKEIFERYAESEFVISNRLHVLLFAAAHGAVPIPVISKSRHSKVSGIFGDSGLDHLVFDTDAMADIAAHIEQLSSSREKLLMAVRSLFASNRKRINAILDKAMNG